MWNLALILFGLVTIASCVTKPRGVPLSKLQFYREDQPFTCLDGSGTIPWTKVNDDYCDCRDASDEPGTSACSNGFFYCENKMHKSEYIPSSRVNDGICDCCDGSDEFSGLASCKSSCWEMGQAAREAKEKFRAQLEEGHKLYQDYIKQVQEKLTAQNTRSQEIDAQLKEVAEKRAEAESAKTAAEGPEKEVRERLEKEKQEKEKEQAGKRELQVFRQLDMDKDGKVTLAEMQTHPEFDIDQSGDVSHEEAKEYLDDHEEVDEKTFLERIYKNIASIYKEPEQKALEADEDKDDELQTSEETPEHKPEEEQDEETKKILADAEAARSAYNEVDEEHRKLEDEKRNLESLLNRDYGPNNAFFILADSSECYEMSDREYTYSLCPFREATQRSKGSGGSGTSLGNWGRWSGPEGRLYTEMVYENGAGCWNGPNRNTKVKITCGAINELTSVSEPSRCEYHYKFSTPLACSQSPEEFDKSSDHDEL